MPGGGAFGSNLTGGCTLRQFPTAEQQIDFVTVGSEQGKPYGIIGLPARGRCPASGSTRTPTRRGPGPKISR